MLMVFWGEGGCGGMGAVVGLLGAWEVVAGAVSGSGALLLGWVLEGNWWSCWHMFTEQNHVV
jgi:hypothetical protein